MSQLAAVPRYDALTSAFEQISKVLPGYRARSSQQQYSRAVWDAFQNNQRLVVEGPVGCHAEGQLVLMFDGGTKRVEEVEVGDRLVGPDGEPRIVLSLARGHEEMVDVVPVKGSPWRVNLGHILTLVETETDKVQDVSVRDWFCWSKWKKQSHKQFSRPANFAPRPVPIVIDPYFMGVILGDGCLRSPTISVTKPDPEVKLACEQAALRHGLRVRSDGKTHHIVGKLNGGRTPNPILRELRRLGLWWIRGEERFVPDDYKFGDHTVRLSVLAGLLDTDGHLGHSPSYDFISKSRRLAADVAFIARSVGLRATEREKVCSGFGITGTYYRVCISGDVSVVPCRIPRKIAGPRLQIKDPCRTGVVLERTGRKEPFFGFSLDRDGRFLLGDCTVTHNTGKTAAYLLPAILSGKKTLVVTAGIALQDQLVDKDLPLIQKVVRPFQFALIKGRSNYFCPYRAAEMEIELATKGTQDERAIATWGRFTKTGDRKESPSNDAAAWKKFSVTSDECLGSDCAHRIECFALQALAQAQGADVVIVNYHLLFTHLKISSVTGGAVQLLPSYDALILDECHAGSDIAREAFGFRLTALAIRRLAQQAERISLGDIDPTPLLQASADFFSSLRKYRQSEAGPRRLKLPDPVDWEPLRREMMSVADKLNHMPGAAEEWDRSKVVKKLQRTLYQHAREISHAMTLNPGFVYYVEDENHQAVLYGKPLDISSLFALAFKSGPVIATSATVTVGGDFKPIIREIGFKPSPDQSGVKIQLPHTLAVDSPYDWPKQAIVVVPKIPDVRQGHVEQDKAILEAVKQAKGRSLVLCTSHGRVKQAREALSDCGYRVMVQGDLPLARLIEEFRSDVSSVLIGTNSLWKGIDIAGQALSCVIIDKLPFDVWTDPLVEALREADEEKGWDDYVARAVIRFRQAAGRLIRNENDRGVLVVLDGRVHTKKYGKTFLRSLPKGIPFSEDLSTIGEFLGEST